MAAMTTILLPFTGNGTTGRTSTISGHTLALPRLVIEKRRVPVGNQIVGEYSYMVYFTAIDANDVAIPQKVGIGSTVRIPLGIKAGQTTVADALAVHRDIVAGDEFAASINTLNWLDP